VAMSGSMGSSSTNVAHLEPGERIVAVDAL
jgi:hypothetical protein